MASKRKWSGAERRKSKRQRELLRGDRKYYNLCSYGLQCGLDLGRFACSMLPDSDWFNCILVYIGCRTLVTTGTSAESKSLTVILH